MRSERSRSSSGTTLEPSLVKFCHFPKSTNIFASLSNSENIEIGMIEPKTKQIVSIYDKSDKPISHTRYVNDIDWSPRNADKQRLASVCRDSSLRIWALRESSVFLQDKRNTVSQAEKVRWDPTESSHLAMVIDRRLKFYDTRKKQFDTFKEWIYLYWAGNNSIIVSY